MLWPVKSCNGMGSHAMAWEVVQWPGKSCHGLGSHAMAWLCYGLAPTRVCEVMLWRGIPLTLLSRPSACATKHIIQRPGGRGRGRVGARGGTWEVMCEGTCEDNKGGDVRGAREGTRRARDTLRQRRDFTRRSTTCRGGRSRRRSVRGPRGAVKGLAAEGL